MTVPDSLFVVHDQENLEATEETPSDLSLNGEFADVIKGGWSWVEFHSFLIERASAIWTAPDSRLRAAANRADDPESHEYSIDIEVISDDNGAETKQCIVISGTNGTATESTLNGVFALLRSCKRPGVSFDITCKLFSMNPRQKLATLRQSSLVTGGNDGATSLQSVRFEFASIDEETIETLSKMHLKEVELRQCTVSGLSFTLSPSGDDDGKLAQNLIISCAMPEFIKFSGSLGSCRTIKSLKLVLHFFLQGDGMKAFCDGLQSEPSGAPAMLESLSISFLDLPDASFSWLCESISTAGNRLSNLRSVKLSFTDNFVDNYRRLTPERRAMRTQEAIDALTNTSIECFEMPKCQESAELMSSLNEILNQNKKNNSLSS